MAPGAAREATHASGREDAVPFHYRETVEVTATPGQVWAVLADVPGWPRWTPTVSTADILHGSFGAGARVRLKQPRLPAAVWTVTEHRPLAGFTWATSGPGVRTEARHQLRVAGGDQVIVELALTQAGPLSPLVHLLTGRLTRRYLSQEARGLKTWCETTPPAA